MRTTWLSWPLLAICIASAGGHASDSGHRAGGAAADDFDPFIDTGIFLSILPPGQSASETETGQEENFNDQGIMYENLVFTGPGELGTEDDLVVGGHFKDAAFLSPESGGFVETVEVGDGTFTATIGFDRFGVPHIFGETRGDVYFGSGYATARDRTFVADVLRHVGRGRLSDFIGPTSENFAQDRSVGLVAGYDEREIQGQIEQLSARFGTTGEQIQADSAAFVAGYNTRLGEVRNTPDEPVIYTALNLELRDWTVRDILAVATLVQAIFAVGGGSEHLQAQLLDSIKEKFVDTGQLSEREACDLWRDIRQADDPEKPATAEGEFATQSPPTIDETACPFEAGFANDYPGAVLFDGDVVERQLLTIEDCTPGGTVQPDCPDVGGSVVDDEVEEGDMAGPAGGNPPPLPWLDATMDRLLAWQPATAAPEAPQTDGRLPPPPYRHDAAGMQAYRQRLAAAREEAMATVAAITRALSFPEMASNAILVDTGQTEARHPIAVFGPQTGYFVANLLYEMSQQGGGVHVRGMSFAGLPYAVIGRGIDFAWSATSAGDDIIDIRVLRLCDADADAMIGFRGYRHNGLCKPLLERIDEWTAEFNAGAPPDENDRSLIGKKVTRHILRAPEYGPVFATATVGGAPVALAIQRSTFFGEVDSAVPFVAISRNEIHDPESFFEVFNTLTGTFNWFYVDSRNIAYFNSGLLPRRAEGIHPDLPSWGTGEFDWAQTGTGRLNPEFSFDNFLPLEAHPRDQNPERGYIANWNNSQAKGFWANDGQTSYGPVDRQELLARRLEAFAGRDGRHKHTPGSMVEIMIDAATTDLRGQEVVSSALGVIDSASEPSLSAEQQRAVAILRAWLSNGTDGLGAMRRDRDGPGQDTSQLVYDDRPAAVFMDTWWDHLIDTALPQITAVETAGDRLPMEERHDLPNDIGSAFNGGYYGYVQRVLDMALGTSAAPYKTLRCAGSETLGDCRAAVIDSIQRTLSDLGTDPAGWDGTDGANGSDPEQTREQDDAIHFQAIGAAEVPDIHWQNRPTFQQVVQPRQRRSP